MTAASPSEDGAAWKSGPFEDGAREDCGDDMVAERVDGLAPPSNSHVKGAGAGGEADGTLDGGAASPSTSTLTSSSSVRRIPKQGMGKLGAEVSSDGREVRFNVRDAPLGAEEMQEDSAVRRSRQAGLSSSAAILAQWREELADFKPSGGSGRDALFAEADLQKGSPFAVDGFSSATSPTLNTTVETARLLAGELSASPLVAPAADVPLRMEHTTYSSQPSRSQGDDADSILRMDPIIASSFGTDETGLTDASHLSSADEALGHAALRPQHQTAVATSDDAPYATTPDHLPTGEGKFDSAAALSVPRRRHPDEQCDEENSVGRAHERQTNTPATTATGEAGDGDVTMTTTTTTTTVPTTPIPRTTLRFSQHKNQPPGAEHPSLTVPAANTSLYMQHQLLEFVSSLQEGLENSRAVRSKQEETIRNQELRIRHLKKELEAERLIRSDWQDRMNKLQPHVNRANHQIAAITAVFDSEAHPAAVNQTLSSGESENQDATQVMVEDSVVGIESSLWKLLRTSLPSLQAMAEKVQSERRDAHSEAASAQLRLAKAQTECDRLRQEAETLETNKDLLERECAKMSQKLETTSDEARSAQRDLEVTRERVEVSRAELLKVQIDTQNRREAIDAAADLLAKRQNDIDGAERICQDRVHYLQQIQRDAETRLSKAEAMEQSFCAREDRITTMMSEVRAVSEQIEIDKLHQLKEKERVTELSKQAERQKGDIKNELMRLQSERMDIEDRERTLKLAQSRLEEETGEVQALQSQLLGLQSTQMKVDAEQKAEDERLKKWALDLNEREQKMAKREEALKVKDAELKEAQSKVAAATLQLEKDRQDLDKQRAALTADANEVRSKGAQIEESTADCDRRVKELLNQQLELERALDDLQEETRTLEQRKCEIKEESHELETERKRILAARLEQENEQKKLDSRMSVWDATVQETDERLKSAEQRLKAWEEDLQRKKDDLTNIVTELSSREEQITKDRVLLEEERSSFAAGKEADEGKWAEKRRETEAALESLRNEKEDASRSWRELVVKKSELQTSIDKSMKEAQEKLASVEKEITEKQRCLTEIERRVDEAEQRERDFCSKAEATRMALQQKAEMLRDETGLLEREKNEHSMAVTNLQTELSDLEKTIEERKAEALRQQADEMATLEKQRLNMERDVSLLRLSAKQELKKVMDSFVRQGDEISEDLDCKLATVEKLRELVEAEADALDKGTTALQLQHAKCHSEKARLESDLREARVSSTRYQSQLEEFRNEVRSLKDAVLKERFKGEQALAKEKAQYGEVLNASESEKTALEMAKTELQSDLENAERRILSLEKFIEHEKEKYKAVVEQRASDTVSGPSEDELIEREKELDQKMRDLMDREKEFEAGRSDLERKVASLTSREEEWARTQREKDVEAKRLVSELDQEKESMRNKMRSLQITEMDIDRRRQSIAEKEKQFDSMFEQGKEEIDKRLKQLAEREVDLDKEKRESARRVESLQEVEADMRRRLQALQEREDKLKDVVVKYEEDRVRKEVALTDNVESMAERLVAVQEAEKEVEERLAVVTGKERDFAALSKRTMESLDRQRVKLQEMEAMMGDQEEKLSFRLRAVASAEAQMAEERRQLEEREGKLMEETRTFRLQKHRDDKDDEKVVSERRKAELDALEATLRQRQQDVEEQHKDAKEAQMRIRDMAAKLKEKDDELSREKSVLKSRLHQCEECEEQLTAWHERLQEVAASLPSRDETSSTPR